jgi:hypothetical protein
MLLWVSRGIAIGAAIGCLLMAAVGYLLGGFMGGMSGIPSLGGDPDVMKREAIRLMPYGAALGIVIGSVMGGIIGAFGHVRVFIIGAIVGAVSLALGGATFGGTTTNDSPINWTHVVVASLIGVCAGLIAGGILGWLASPLDRYFVRKL